MGRSERITAAEDIEETIMLGLRIREGLDTRQFSHLIPEQKWIELEHDGLFTMLDGRAIPTLRGRLLNDTIITELLKHWIDRVNEHKVKCVRMSMTCGK